MENISLFKLHQNIFDKVIYLKQDYLGIHFDINALFNLFLGFTVAFGLIALSNLLGKKIVIFLFKKNDLENNYLINTALGYITIATGITILGIFSILSRLLFIYY